jgi:sec-independent protein translocase protein TatA
MDGSLGGQMGQLGFSEMLMIFVIALLVFGPKKLPELGKSLGKGIREFKKATDELKSNWEDQVKDITQPLNDVKQDIHSMGQNLKTDLYKHLDTSSAQPESQEHTTTTQAVAETHEAPAHPAESSTPKEHV